MPTTPERRLEELATELRGVKKPVDEATRASMERRLVKIEEELRAIRLEAEALVA